MHHKTALLLTLSLLGTAPCAYAADADGDGIDDAADNCTDIANADQRDTDGDLFGNRCDSDLNNDGLVNFADLGLLRANFFMAGDLDSDLDGDGQTNFNDLSIMRSAFFDAPGPSGAAAAATGIVLTPVYTTLDLDFPMIMHQAPGDAAHWYVAERAGRILRFENVPDPGAPEVVLDIVDRVDTFFEGGLLGFAFHPDFAANGRLYVSYTTTGQDDLTNPLDSRIGLFTPDAADPDRFDALSEVVVIEIDQPRGNHNGGDLAFGPDGMLYLSLGDGGGSDARGNSQDTTTLHGSILRLDVDIDPTSRARGVTYQIPADNPFAASDDCSTGCPEIYAWGLRNPYRFSFDRRDGDFYAGDVGQFSREEIDLIVSGGNYGWPCYEGNLAFDLDGCASPSSYLFPLIDYGRSLGSTVTGGYVYRGTAHPALRGAYLYGDYGSGRIWALVGGTPIGELVNSTISIVAFAEGLAGELYVLDLISGKIYRIDAAS